MSPRIQSDGKRQPVTYSIIQDTTDNRIFDLLVIDSVSGELFVKHNTATNNQPAYDKTNGADNTYIITLDANDITHNSRLELTLTLTDSFILKVKVVAKALYFEWETVTNDPKIYYKLYEKLDGKSGFSVIPTGNNIQGNSYRRNIALYLNDMSNAQYYLEAYEQSSNPTQGDTLLNTSDILQIKPQFVKALDYVGYVKASDTQGDQYFGRSVSLSGDGYTLAVGADGDSGNAGAVYLYTREPRQDSAFGPWTFATKLTAPNAGANDNFGISVALSSDGAVLAVGAVYEDNAATGTAEPGKADLCTTGQESNCALDSGAVYVFQRPLDASGKSDWSAWIRWDTGKSLADHKVAYLKAPNPGRGDQFGNSVALSADGAVLAVAANLENNVATGIAELGNPKLCSATGVTCALDSGAVYVFQRPLTGGWAAWTGWDTSKSLADHNVAYLKAPNAGEADTFGYRVALSADGAVLAVGAIREDNAATGGAEPGYPNVCPAAGSTCANRSGAVYVFQRPLTGGWAAWTGWDTSKSLAEHNVAYLKAPNAGANDFFGWSVALSADGAVLAVGAAGEDNGATGTAEPGAGSDLCTGTASETLCAGSSGAVYVFQSPLKNASGDINWADWTGWDSSNLKNADNSLAAHNVAYLKAPNAGTNDFFGWSMALSADGAVLAVGAYNEDSDAKSQANTPIQGVPLQPVNGVPTPVINDNAVDAGAVYLY